MHGVGGHSIAGDGYQAGDGSDYAYGDRLVGRVMAQEYNLAVQRGDDRQASNVMLRMIGQWLSNRFSR